MNTAKHADLTSPNIISDTDPSDGTIAMLLPTGKGLRLRSIGAQSLQCGAPQDSDFGSR